MKRYFRPSEHREQGANRWSRTRKFPPKIRIVLEVLRGEDSIADLCRREGINPNLYYKWSKEFLEAGKARLTGDTKRQASSSEVDDLRRENEALKQVVAELLLKNRVLKKSVLAGESEPWEA